MRTRRHVAALVVLLAATSAHAGDGADVKRARESGTVITDGKGHYIAFVSDPGNTAYDDEVARHIAWYGNGKTFFAMNMGVSASSSDAQWMIDDMRVGLDAEHSSMKVDKGVMTFRCDDRYTVLTAVPADAARAMLKKAVFKPRSFQRKAFAAGRDGTTYYLIDIPEDITPKTKNQSRLYIGKRGGMKEVKVTKVEIDNSGTLFTTAKGSFRTTRAMFARVDNRSSILKHDDTWKPTSGDSIELSDLDHIVNGRLIYSELGVYPSKMGMPCDDL